MNWKDFEPKFATWSEFIKPIFDKGIFDLIYKRLKEDSRTKTIVPESKNTFKAFELCDKNNTKVVFMGLDPYPWIKDGKYVADGLCFSCGNHNEMQPSLEHIYKAIREEYPTTSPIIYLPTSLSYWAEQGVLLLNSSLTTVKDKVGYYNNDKLRLWEDFFVEFLTEYSFTNSGIIFVFFGKVAQRYADFVRGTNYVFKVEHPAAAAHAQREWEHKNIFSKINDLLKENNNESIDWGFNNYLPF